MPRKKTEKKDTIILTKYNRHQFVSVGEINNEPSQTSQGEAISMAEMIRRYTRGEIPPMAQSAFYGHDVDIDAYEGHKHSEDPLTEMAEVRNQLEISKAEGRAAAKQKTETKSQQGDGSEAMKDGKRERSESESHEPATEA